MKYFFFLIMISTVLMVSRSSAQEIEDIQETIIYMDYLLTENPNNSIYLGMRGWAYHFLDSLELALNDYSAAIKYDENNPDLYFRRGDVYFDLKNYNKSITDYTTAIFLSNQDSLQYFVSRGVAYEKINAFNKALLDYDYVLRNQPKNEFALRNRAVLHVRKFNQIEMGLKDFETLLSLYPKSEYFGIRGVILIERDLYESAILDFTKAIEITGKKNAYYLKQRGKCYVSINRAHLGIVDFSNAIELESNNPEGYILRGSAYINLNEKKLACIDFNSAKMLGASTSEVFKIKCD